MHIYIGRKEIAMNVDLARGRSLTHSVLTNKCDYGVGVYFRISLKRGQTYCSKFQGRGNNILNIGNPIAKKGGGRKHPLILLK